MWNHGQLYPGVRTLGEAAHSKLVLRPTRQVSQCNVRFPLADHEVDDNKRFEDDCPC